MKRSADSNDAIHEIASILADGFLNLSSAHYAMPNDHKRLQPLERPMIQSNDLAIAGKQSDECSGQPPT